EEVEPGGRVPIRFFSTPRGRSLPRRGPPGQRRPRCFPRRPGHNRRQVLAEEAFVMRSRAPSSRPVLPLAWHGLLSRRDLLRVCSVGLAAAALPSWLTGAARARTATPAPEARARSVILLWMAGGVTHLDSFDPKPDAPKEIRGTLGALATCLPGV